MSYEGWRVTIPKLMHVQYNPLHGTEMVSPELRQKVLEIIIN